jgi:cytoskeletal protein CcmA (bactofilin family)
MFRRKRKHPIEVTRLESLVAASMTVTGDVEFSSGLRVDGRIHGNVGGAAGARGLLVLSEHGTINGSVRAYDAVINGTITGDLDVEHFLELQPNAHVTGNITYRQLQLECGAAVEGRLVCAAADAEPAAAPPAPRRTDLKVLELPGPVRTAGT